jgi:uncharacterized protein (TIGR03083 family)
MDDEALLAALASEGNTLSALANGNLDRAVPTCPGWDVAQVLTHLGGVYGWAAEVVASEGERPSRPRPEPPAQRSQLLGWFDEQRGKLLAELRSRHPDQPAWAFPTAVPQTVAWWYRRQALETAMHRVDVERAAGDSPSPIGSELAIDGIDEYLTYMLPGALRRLSDARPKGTLHLHATDADGEWWLDLDAEEVMARREHAKADTALRGPASGLYTWLWNRQTATEAGIELFGDPSIEESWQQVKV